MTLFLDRHIIPTDGSVTPESVAADHKLDEEVQGKYGVCYHGYYFDPTNGRVMCFVEGPNREACEAVHREAHGLTADDIIEVTAAGMDAFLSGRPSGPAMLPDGSPDSAVRILLLTELTNLAAVAGKLGDDAARQVLESHDGMVREAAAMYKGREVQRTGGEVMVSFISASHAVACAIEIQRKCAEAAQSGAPAPVVKIGIAAGEPVTHHASLFGFAVEQVRAICRAANPGTILVSAAVRELCAGKDLGFQAADNLRPQGHDEPIRVATVTGVRGVNGSNGGDHTSEAPPLAETRDHPVSRLEAGLRPRYEVQRELGAGGMATVYLARDVRHDRLVAIKVLRPELAAVLGADRFLQEIRLVAKLTHPNIVPLHDSGEASGMLYYVMPHLEGESLRQAIAREGRLPVDRAIEIVRGIAAALGYAHRHGVIHRDIKPENILMHEGHPMLTDFGISLAISQAGGDRLTETGLSLGTPCYMSPEQAVGDKAIDLRTDVYALGCVVFEMLAGEPPFTGANLQALIAKVLTEPAPLLSSVRSDVPEPVVRGVHRALARTPDGRFDSAAEFAAALEAG
jgi:class 3 adenylate cyclase